MPNNKKVLIISKNDFFLDRIKNSLGRYNYSVDSTTAQGLDLVELLKGKTPDFTIFDTPLGSIDGIRQLVAIRERVDTPVFMLSSQYSQADKVNTINLDSRDQHRIKPLSTDELALYINDVIGNSNQNTNIFADIS